MGSLITKDQPTILTKERDINYERSEMCNLIFKKRKDNNGNSIDLVQNAPPKTELCHICLKEYSTEDITSDVLKDIGETSCCQKTYCITCFDKWIATAINNRSCPSCRNPNPSLLIKEELIKRYPTEKIKCKYCKVKIQLSLLIEHESDCLQTCNKCHKNYIKEKEHNAETCISNLLQTIETLKLQRVNCGKCNQPFDIQQNERSKYGVNLYCHNCDESYNLRKINK